ncbi:hypothetical protein [Tropicibacter oceani]|uniref:Apea-like HEPN domain-containing protein n=1 Tax=Tropicibacter oceani TaxID=3058420 RepID=A0ABY8QH32_9RHOB|nr:hypothetical protein [Tropicibacter oceani]WGW03952.1 hypothetical protein QF118_18870 [Tropicibacter oceani]
MRKNEITLIHMPGITLPKSEVRSTEMTLVALEYRDLEEFDGPAMEAQSRFIENGNRKNCFLRFNYANNREYTQKLADLLHLALVLESEQSSCPPPPCGSIRYYRVYNEDPLEELLDSMGLEFPSGIDDEKMQELRFAAKNSVEALHIEKGIGHYGRNLLLTGLASTYSPTLETLQRCQERAQAWARAGIEAIGHPFLPLEPLFMWQKEDPIHRVIRLSSLVIYIEGRLLNGSVSGIIPTLSEEITKRFPMFHEHGIKKKIRSLYSMRSDFIHGRRIPDEWGDRDSELLSFAANLIRAIVEADISAVGA